MQSDEQHSPNLPNTQKGTGIKNSRVSPVGLKRNMATPSISTLYHQTEKDIQKAIMDYLAVNRIFAWRNNVGSGIHRNATGGQYFVKYGMKGASDIIGILPDGRFLAIEVKKYNGVLSPSQIEFLHQIKSRGGVALMARSVDDVIKELRG